MFAQLKEGDMIKLKIKRQRGGFTLIEILLCIGLIAVALLGLAQIFTLSVLNNMRSDRITTANFLAQQQVDYLRNLTSDEINDYFLGRTIDEILDVNNDTTPDYRRLTRVEPAIIQTPEAGTLTGTYYQVKVLVFSAEQINTDQDKLQENPERYRVKAQLNTIISR